MLLDFQVSNFRAFAKPALFSLAASNYDASSLPGNMITPKLPGISRIKFLRGAAVYGANASGKSNLIRAIFYLKRLVRQSYKSERGEELPHDPFLLNETSKHEPTLIAIRFVAKGIRYHYELAFTAQRVLEESLSAFPNGIAQLWFRRQWDEEKNDYVYSPDKSEYFIIRSIDKETSKENALFLSTLGNLTNHPKIGDVYDWFRNRLAVINLSESSELEHANTLNRFKKDKQGILRFLKQADLGITDINLQKKPLPEKILESLPEELQKQTRGEYVDVIFSHRGEGGKEYNLGLEDESVGTGRFFALIGAWMDLIEDGKVLFLDELETSLHPLLTRELVRMAMDPNINTKNAQIIFATHDPLLLDRTLLRRDQIWLTEKTDEGDSILYALSEYKNAPNNRESLVRGYLSGRYGGVPFIPEGLM
ncbi:MAG: ATP/GTP-binding protein [Candidatus Methylacidiphilales bacterium]